MGGEKRDKWTKQANNKKRYRHIDRQRERQPEIDRKEREIDR